ncbi:MAG: hypothetical protein HY683_05925 [Chloroflexi bacterium]|nr:hypothetical protein [Chloroflexota bacterium]
MSSGRSHQGQTNDPTTAAQPVLMGLSTLRTRLALVHAACLMAMEGTTRAPVLQVVERAAEAYGVIVAASEGGQTFTALGVGTATTHGKVRLVLEPAQLQRIQERLAAQVEAAVAQVEEAVKRFGDLAARVAGLEEHLQQTVCLARRQWEIQEFVQQHRAIRDQAEAWEMEYDRAREEVARVEQLRRACADLDQKARALPDLQERRKALQQALRQHEADDAELAKQEKALADRVQRLRDRYQWVELARVQQAIEDARRELDDLQRQLGEKRSLLGRVFGKKPGQGQASHPEDALGTSAPPSAGSGAHLERGRGP